VGAGDLYAVWPVALFVLVLCRLFGYLCCRLLIQSDCAFLVIVNRVVYSMFRFALQVFYFWCFLHNLVQNI